MRFPMLVIFCVVACCLCAQTAGWEFYNTPISRGPMVATPNYVYIAGRPGLFRINNQTQAVERFYTFNSGLPIKWIRALHYDQNGTLWIGGDDNKLASFDGGEEWQLHDLSGAPVPTGQINCIDSDSMGNLWLGCTYGLFKTDLVNWVRFTASDVGIPEFVVWVLLVDSQDRVWAGSSGSWGDLVCLSEGQWSVAGTDWGQFYYLLEDHSGNIWLGADDLRRFDGSAWSTIPSPGIGVGWYYFQCGTMDNYNNFYTATLLGDIFKYSGNTWSIYQTTGSNVEYGSIVSMASDQQNNIFYAKKEVYRNQVPIPGLNVLANDNRVVAAERDSQDRLWLAHVFRGVSCFDGNGWQHFGSTTHSMLSNMIYDLALDSADTLWVVLGNGYLKHFGNQWVYQQPPAGLLSQRHYAQIAIDPRDNVWLGGNYGLLRYNGGSWQAYTPDNSILPVLAIKFLEQDSFGRTWIVTTNGLVVHDRGDWQLFNSANAPFASHVFLALRGDSQGRVWALSATHLYKYEGNNWSAHPLPLEVNTTGDTYPNIGVDGFGKVWVNLYNNGMAVFDGIDWQLVPYGDSPLQSSIIYSLLSEPDGRLWFWMTGGLQSYFEQPVALSDQPLVPPQELRLSAHPNPCNLSAVIRINLAESGACRLEVFNTRGQLVRRLGSRSILPAGEHEVFWDGADMLGRPVVAGIYLLRLEANGARVTRKLAVLR